MDIHDLLLNMQKACRVVCQIFITLDKGSVALNWRINAANGTYTHRIKYPPIAMEEIDWDYIEGQVNSWVRRVWYQDIGEPLPTIGKKEKLNLRLDEVRKKWGHN